ncbi:MAG TPA: hypothetical protein PKK48_03530 [Phycisphaerae bacterium]|nr:hypothetical protein [Phycisphaerae bacterium]HPS53044.1 hypothetical protein [Phycisphaerae bacterium]
MMFNERAIAMRKIFAIFMILAFVSGVSSADVGRLTDAQKRELLAEAQSEYDRGTSMEAASPDEARAAYTNAAEKFQVVVSSLSRPGGWLYYDLGNAYLKSGRLGLAIANYKRAAQYIGGDSRLTSNLDYARGMCASQLPQPRSQGWSGALAAMNRRVSATVRLWIGIGGWCVMWLGILGKMFIRRRRWRMLILSGAAVCVLTAASLAWEYSVLADDYQGVITARETVIRKGNGIGYAPLFKEPLCEGAEFRVLDERRGWLEVQLGDGKTGWIPKTAAELIAPRKMF